MRKYLFKSHSPVTSICCFIASVNIPLVSLPVVNSYHTWRNIQCRELQKNYSHNLRMFIISSSVCPCQIIRPILMFVGKAMSLNCSGTPERCFTRVGSSLTCKHYTRLERLSRIKYYSLFRTFINCYPVYSNV
jgi:hypothetical protein